MRRLLLTLVFALGLSGCSAILTRKAPLDYRSRGEFECTEHYVFPVVDGALAALGVWFIASVWQPDQDEYSKVGGTGMGLLWAVGYGMSAGFGYDRVRTCRDAQAEMRGVTRSQPGPPGG